ncbi:radical SAM protein [Pseudodesulfovibrio tunisiensis]|uniref:radical SAM protein n=1 Tax=Pseudodesulfovibrio tunisiensis TaxID=463192 RepID=UPI001FB2CE38|nr:radical SAM protein [Pseudodesulfovibrio tunisiensis]
MNPHVPVNNLLWNMTRKCNFRCEYCYFPHDNTPVETTLPVERILDFLSATNEKWTVGMTGGEPFIYPKFVDICAALSAEHRIAVDTNLSVSSKVRDFAERIDPDRVDDLYVALHIAERERVKGVPAFIENARLLLDKGFNVIVNYVVHPDLLDRYHEDAARFASHDIRITPRPFKGRHEGRRYPEAYGEQGRAVFADFPEQGRKIAYNFEGIPCSAGRTLLRMEPDGTVFRCPGDKTVLGNVMEDVTLLDGDEPCRVRRCPCRGLDHLRLEPFQQHMVNGVQYLVVGDPENARAELEQADSLRPGLGQVLNNLGVAAWKQGQRGEAADLFARGLDAAPESETLRANLAGILDPAPDFEPGISLRIVPTA